MQSTFEHVSGTDVILVIALVLLVDVDPLPWKTI